MKLQDVNKARYRKHLNIVIAALIISLMILGVGFGQVLIALLSDGQGSHFIYNITGVIAAALLCGKAVHSVKGHDFMVEVYYVWQLKQGLNAIYRKLKKIETARDEGDINALIVLNYYYSGSEQLLNLDDNTITMDSLNKNKDTLQSLIASKNLNVSVDDYSADLLAGF